MNVPLRWLREFVPDAPDAHRVGEALTLGGLPVEHVTKSADGEDVLDVEVTSNRSDCLSIVGVAREVAALLKLEFRDPQTSYEPIGATSTPKVGVDVEATDACPYYSARVIRGVTIAPSPAWLAQRLEAVGVRPINNVVDVTNYVLFELGQPLHAFDLGKLSGPTIAVRFARDGESLVTLDSAERKLNASTLVIADASGPVAMAGVMGGEPTGVTDATVDVLLESARFDPLVVRKAARGYALASDSSYRFERGLDPTLARRASDRAVQLICDLAGGRADGDLAEAGGTPTPPAPIVLRVSELTRTLGVKVEAFTDWSVDAIGDALGRLGFDATFVGRVGSATAQADNRRFATETDAGEKSAFLAAYGPGFEVRVPSHRLDVAIERDLVEEVARVVGYDQIPTRDEVPVRLTQREPARVALDVIRAQLHAGGFFEAMTFSFVTDALAEPFQHAEAATLHRVESATRKADARLRPSVLPNLLESLRHNENNGVAGARLYETASVFWLDANGKSVERRALGMVGDDDYRALRGTVEHVLRALDRRRPIAIVPTTRAGFGGRACGEVRWGDASVGTVGKVDRAVAEKVGLRGMPAMAELWLEPLLAGHVAVPTLVPLPKFPAVRRDLSLLVNETVRYAEIESIVRELKLEALEAVEFVTTYRGKPLEKGQKSVTIALAFRRPDGTLTGGEVDERVNAVTASASTKLGATLRA